MVRFLEYRKVGYRMIKVFKYKNGEIRIKYNEPPLVRDYKYEWIKKQIRIKTFKLSSPFLLGVELAVHKGGRICYGMLAAQVKPHSKQDCVNLSLAFTQENTITFEDACIINDTHVYKGLPKEYTSEIIKKIYSLISQKESYPQCSIIFEDSANCEVGSSPIIFGIIAEIITNIIFSDSVNEILNLDIETFTKLYVKNINFQY